MSPKKKILFTTVTTLAFAAFCILIFRACVPSHPNKGCIGEFEPNRSVIVDSDQPYRLTTDRHGFRWSGSPDSMEDRFKILCLGDSFTFGFSMDDRTTYPFYLRHLLRNVHPFVANAGVSGYGVRSELEAYEAKYSGIGWDIVVVQPLANDMSENFPRGSKCDMSSVEQYRYRPYIPIRLLARLGRHVMSCGDGQSFTEAQYRALLGKLLRDIRRDGSRCVVAVPFHDDRGMRTTWREMAAANGCAYADMRDYAPNATAEYVSRWEYTDPVKHLSAYGNRIFAETVTAAIHPMISY